MTHFQYSIAFVFLLIKKRVLVYYNLFLAFGQAFLLRVKAIVVATASSIYEALACILGRIIAETGPGGETLHQSITIDSRRMSTDR